MKKEALKELIPSALEQAIKDIVMYRDVKEDSLSSTQVRSIIDPRNCADVQNQIIRMEVDAVNDEWAYGPDGKQAPPADVHAQPEGEWVASLGYGLTQGAVGKSGKGKDDSKNKGKGYDKDWKGSTDKGKGLGAGKGERPVELALTVGGSGITTGHARYV